LTAWGIFSSAALGQDGTVYFGPKDGRLLALDGKTGRVKWGYRIGTTIETSPVVTPDGTVYLGADDAKLYALKPPAAGGEGQLLWSYQTRGTLISSPVIGPNRSLYIGSMDGTLYAFGPESAGAPRRSGALSGTWYGTYLDSGSAGTMTLVTVQQGSALYGIWQLQGGGRGALEGTVNGETATFVLAPLSESCPASGVGTATLTPSQISGTYRGQHCMGKIDAGTFTVQR